MIMGISEAMYVTYTYIKHLHWACRGSHTAVMSANVIDHRRSASLYITWRHSLAASQLVRQHMRCDAWLLYLSRGLAVYKDAWQHVGAAS